MICDKEERNNDDNVENDDDDDNVPCSHSLLRHPVVHCQNNPKTRQLFLHQNSREHTLLMLSTKNRLKMEHPCSKVFIIKYTVEYFGKIHVLVFCTCTCKSRAIFNLHFYQYHFLVIANLERGKDICVYRVDVCRRKLSDTFCHNYRLAPKTIRPTNHPQQMDLLICFSQLFYIFEILFTDKFQKRGNYFNHRYLYTF